MIPNIVGAMATSPVLINSLVGLFGNVHGGSFTEAQVQTVLLTDAVTNASTLDPRDKSERGALGSNDAAAEMDQASAL